MIGTPANGRTAASPDDRTEGTVGGRIGSPKEEDILVWEVNDGASRNYEAFGNRLAASPDLYRNRSEGHGLVLVLPSGQTRLIGRAAELAPVVADRISMVVTKEGKVVSELPKAEHLNAMLHSERFLRCFRPVDEVFRAPYYLDDYTPVQAGYHDGGPGRRILYVGPVPETSDSLESLHAFLNVMEFASEADRTNAVGAALTVLLRHHWLGQKPLILITATKSHAGKGTITDFLRGSVPKADILYGNIDWPMQSQFQRQLRTDPDIGVVVLDNIRLDSAGGRGRFIRSAFIEGFTTSADLTLASPGAGEPLRLANKYVVVVNTNDGSLSIDLLNRSLPIHLDPRGSTEDRQSPIGNPKLEYLPKNQGRIEAELRGMIERWRTASCPLDERVTHSMTPWARIIGGILRHNGFTHFLANQGTRKAADELLRRAIGILGAAKPGVVLRPKDWAKLAVEHGLVKTLIPANERDTEKGRERAIGVLLKPLRGETFEAETEAKKYRLRLEGGLRRWQAGETPHVRYRFVVLDETELPEEGSV
jgi:hypothetical protein